jgi:hypothetical protein
MLDLVCIKTLTNLDNKYHINKDYKSHCNPSQPDSLPFLIFPLFSAVHQTWDQMNEPDIEFSRVRMQADPFINVVMMNFGHDFSAPVLLNSVVNPTTEFSFDGKRDRQEWGFMYRKAG